MDRIPILKLENFLLVTVQGEVHDRLATDLQNDLTARIAETGARGVLIDISAVDVVDSFMARVLADIATIARVLAAETVVVGMQPAVAITLVELGLSLPHVHTSRDIDKGMALLRSVLTAQKEARHAGGKV